MIVLKELTERIVAISATVSPGQEPVPVWVLLECPGLLLLRLEASDMWTRRNNEGKLQGVCIRVVVDDEVVNRIVAAKGG